MKKESGGSRVAEAGEDAKAAARDRVRRHREGLRARGLRPIQIWIPDTRKPGFQTEIDRQCAAINDPVHDAELYAFMDAVLADMKWD